MKVEIPDNLKAEVPQTLYGRILSATPVVMAVVATMLAGLSSSEMTRAQYARSLAAQRQSKAGDQWSFFQAKRLRGTLQRNTVDLLQAGGELRPLDAAATTDPALQPGWDYLVRGEVPPLPAAAALDPKIEGALKALETTESDAEIAARLEEIPTETLDAAVRAARERVLAFDKATQPINRAVEALEKRLTVADPAGARNIIAARLRYTAQRYDAEARLNQHIATLYELQVRQSNAIAERHHARSQRFFYGMLAAQAAVIISTFAIAARQRNLLWSLAAAAGLVAVGFAVWVYLYV